jgi:hypothetical protein
LFAQSGADSKARGVSKSVDVGLSGDVGVDLAFDNHLGVDVPTSYSFDITHIPKISIGLDPITINPLTVNPLDVSVRLKEIPSIRTHVPANFTLGLSVLGYDLACVRLCGEAQVITEPYVPNPCEHCGQVHLIPAPPPGTVTPANVAGVPK